MDQKCSLLSPAATKATQRRTNCRARNFDDVLDIVGGRNWYQVRLVLATQLGYLTVTGSMLCTMFVSDIATMRCYSPALMDNSTDTMIDSDHRSYFLVSKRVDICKCIQNATIDLMDPNYFYSLMEHLNLACENSYIPTLFTTAVMLGGVVGAVVFGQLADLFGRWPMNVATLAGTCLFNFLVLPTPASMNYWIYVVVIYFCMGFCGGGFMVVNLVLMLESFGKNWRLFATSLNGWPLAIMYMSLVGYLTRHWRWFHLVLACQGVLLLLLFFMVYESPRWLLQHGRFDEAQTILINMARINNRTIPDFVLHNEKESEASAWSTSPDDGGQNRGDDHENTKPVINLRMIAAQPIVEVEETNDRLYTYVDLVKYRSVLLPLFALFYSWLASSIISFGIYFNLGALAGNQFLNAFSLGLLKGITGMIPFAVSKWVGRKPVLITAVTVACVSVWAAGISYMIKPEKGIQLTVFAIVGAAAVDPIWKVNHLYSTELFPTVVRNMARGMCNVGSRIGSVIGPQANFLKQIYFPLPYLIFGVLSIGHLLVCIFALPETKGKPMPDKLNEDDRIEWKSCCNSSENGEHDKFSNVMALDDMNGCSDRISNTRSAVC